MMGWDNVKYLVGVKIYIIGRKKRSMFFFRENCKTKDNVRNRKKQGKKM